MCVRIVPQSHMLSAPTWNKSPTLQLPASNHASSDPLRAREHSYRVLSTAHKTRTAGTVTIRYGWAGLYSMGVHTASCLVLQRRWKHVLHSSVRDANFRGDGRPYLKLAWGPGAAETDKGRWANRFGARCKPQWPRHPKPCPLHLVPAIHPFSIDM